MMRPSSHHSLAFKKARKIDGIDRSTAIVPEKVVMTTYCLNTTPEQILLT
jgi:hypothetical protein